MSTEMLADICDRGQSHLDINGREARYKIHDCIKQRQLEWKALNMVKGLHKVFKAVVNEISQYLPLLG